MLQTAVRTNHDFKVARFQHVVEAAVIELQQVVSNLKRHLPALALFQMDSFTGRVMLATTS